MDVPPEHLVAKVGVVASEQDEGVPHLVHVAGDHADSLVAEGDQREVLAELADRRVDDGFIDFPLHEELLSYLSEGVVIDSVERPLHSQRGHCLRRHHHDVPPNVHYY